MKNLYVFRFHSKENEEECDFFVVSASSWFDAKEKAEKELKRWNDTNDIKRILYNVTWLDFAKLDKGEPVYIGGN